MKKLRKFFALLLCMGLCLSLVPGAWAEETGRPYKTAVLNINWTNIQAVGHQDPSGEACSCYALAYCRTLLDNKTHSWDEYNMYGSSEYNVKCDWSRGNYASHGIHSGKDEAFEFLYSEVCKGYPVIAKVNTALGHFVTVVGVTNVPSSGNLSASNFLIINPSGSGWKLDNMADCGYDLKFEDDCYLVVYSIDSPPISFSEMTPFITTYLDKCTAYPTNLTVKTTKSTYLKALPCTYNTDHNSTNVITSALPVGTSFTITELYRNDYDQYDTCWYKVSYDGKEGYIYSGDTSITSYNSNTISTSGGNPIPTTIPKDRGYWVEWLLSSDYLNIDTVQGYISYQGGDVLPGYPSEKTGINSKTYQLGSNGRDEPVDAGLPFSTLSPGKYTCSIQVKCLYYYGDSNGNLQTQPVWKTAISFNFTKEGDSAPSNPTEILPEGIGLTQNTSYTCTLASAAMMLRARMYRSNNSYWTSVTEESIKPVAWCDDGLYHNFTYNIEGNSMTVGYANCSGISVSELKTLLDNHPEGVVLYERSIPHAVFVCDYQGDTFYCFDPANSSYSGRRTLSSSYLGTRLGNQTIILDSADAYWYVSSYSITPSVSPEMTTGAGRTIPDGNYIIASAEDDRYYLDIDGAAYPASNGTNVILWGPRGESLSACDTWTITYINDGGFYSICQNGTDMSLDVYGGSVEKRANIQVHEANSTAAQKWSISQNDNGSYRIQAKCSGLCLDFDDGSLVGGTNVKQWSANDSIAQQWVFIPYGTLVPAQNSKITFHPQGGLLGEPVASRVLDGINTGRLSGQLIAYMSPLPYSDCNAYGHEIAVDSTGLVVGTRGYGDENQLPIPDGGFVLSGQYAWPEDANDGSHFLYDNVETGQYVSIDYDSLEINIYNSYVDYLANNKYVTTSEIYGELPDITREGYVFEGWYTEPEGGTKIDSDSVYITSNLYAHWVSLTYTVTYNANGGTGTPDNQTKTYGTDLTLSSTKPSHANASAGKYTVSFNANGGSVSLTSLDALRTTCYSFKNWNTKADGSGTSYIAGANYTANADVTLYAQWNPDSTTTAAITLPTPTRSGYVFKGWATSSTATTGVTGNYIPTGNVTLYAVWIKPDLTLPAALTTIESEAFAGGGFSSVLIPPTVKTIALDAFGDRTDLTILGTSGSYAETFAGLKNFTFVPAA